MTAEDVAYAHRYATPQCVYLGGRPAQVQRMESMVRLPAWEGDGNGKTMRIGYHKGWMIVLCSAPSGRIVGVVAVPPRR